MININQICVVGLGYVGLPLAALLTKNNIKVLGVDTNTKVVNNLNKNKIILEEQKLEKIIKKAISKKLLKASLTPEQSCIFILAVPTPIDKQLKPNISYLLKAAKSIAPFLKKGNLIIIESTIPAGTTLKILMLLKTLRKDLIFPNNKNKKKNIFIAYCPERILPGNTLKELIENERVIGGVSNKCSDKALYFYKHLLMTKGKHHITSVRTAEHSKLFENSYRDLNIAFANEVTLFCDRNKVNVLELIKLTNSHPRVNILKPSHGVGGHCIPVDPYFLISQNSKTTKLIQLARKINNSMPKIVTNRIIRIVKELIIKKNICEKKVIITCLGLSYKPDSQDFRNSPSIEVVRMLRSRFSGMITVADPYIKKIPNELKGLDISIEGTKKRVRKENIIIILTKHKEYKKIKSLYTA